MSLHFTPGEEELKGRAVIGSALRHSDRPAAIYATPCVCQQWGGSRWWEFHCGFTSVPFPGLYSFSEREQLLSIFKDRRKQITTAEFWQAVERVLKSGDDFVMEAAQ